ncbi:aspartyl protease [Arcticibacter tournemirensis]|uniref:Aspartyl protease n=1 Tax=Arcticibacter tournemirensis TaxID=699437 RepID=A0A5M9HDZ8_9SPHI|nr:aspartyl protease family protein [Arcticibacter tournemirensis]KAA8483554.1 hypothetical protein F1649_08235 [Arcticibacter tournemirensis]TQM51497.1 aspartyl protease [Arcticibacter tournemirensis]
MKKLILTIALSVSVILSSFAQRNYAQELVNLLQQGRCFEAMEFRTKNADKLPANDSAFNVLYKAHMALFFNKPDSAVIYLEDLIANHELKIGPGISSYYGKLLSVHGSKQQFKEGIKVCDKYIEHLRINPFDQAQDFIHKEMSSVESIKKALQSRDVNEPRIKIKRDNSSKYKTIRISDMGYIRFNAKYNDITAETWFSTGATAYFMLTRSLADKIGTKLVDKTQDSIQIVNDIPTKARIEVIDQINLGGVKLYNIPVLVFNDRLVPYTTDTLNVKTKSKDKAIASDRQIIMGLPAMKMIGMIDFDWKNRTVSFPVKTENIVSSDSSRTYLLENSLYIDLKINGLNYVGYIDTGSDDFLNMTYSFYMKNKSQIEIDSTAQKKPFQRHTMAGSYFNIPHELVKGADVYLNSRMLNHGDGEVVVSDRKSHATIFDGVVGVNFFRRLGSKITFDFDNMRVKVSD